LIKQPAHPSHLCCNRAVPNCGSRTADHRPRVPKGGQPVRLRRGRAASQAAARLGSRFLNARLQACINTQLSRAPVHCEKNKMENGNETVSILRQMLKGARMERWSEGAEANATARLCMRTSVVLASRKTKEPTTKNKYLLVLVLALTQATVMRGATSP